MFLYHVVFRNRKDAARDAKSDSATGKSGPIKFNAILWGEPGDQSVSRKVRHTGYSTDELVKIGRGYRVSIFNQQAIV